jgi:hypothetical protein
MTDFVERFRKSERPRLEDGSFSPTQNAAGFLQRRFNSNPERAG